MREISFKNFRIFVLNSGEPILDRLRISESEYEFRCKDKGKRLQTQSIKLQYNGVDNPYCERSESTEHFEYNSKQEHLPPELEYFLEDETEQKIQAILELLRSRT